MALFCVSDCPSSHFIVLHFVIAFFSCSEVSGRVSGKVSVLDVFFLPWSARSSHFIVFTFRSSLPSFQEISAPKENNKHVLKIGNTMQYYGVSSGDMFVIRHTCLSLFFSVVLKFPEESLEKFLCWMFFFALVSQVLSFYSLHIPFFSPVISRDQCPQREQQTFPQDWEDYAILWSILWRYVCHTCLSLFFSVVLKFPEESLEKFLCWMFFFCLGQPGPLIL